MIILIKISSLFNKVRLKNCHHHVQETGLRNTGIMNP